jgi:hypothetical protein
MEQQFPGKAGGYPIDANVFRLDVVDFARFR